MSKRFCYGWQEWLHWSWSCEEFIQHRPVHLKWPMESSVHPQELLLWNKVAFIAQIEWGSRITALEIGVPTCANPLELRWWSVRAQRLGVTESSRGFHECQGITHWSINSILRGYSTPTLFLPVRLQPYFQERCAITQVLLPLNFHEGFGIIQPAVTEQTHICQVLVIFIEQEHP